MFQKDVFLIISNYLSSVKFCFEIFFFLLPYLRLHTNVTCIPKDDVRLRSSTDIDRLRSNIPRSRSAQSLKNMDQGGTEDKVTIVAQMFWIAVSLLESDYEYEFSLAVRLLEKVGESCLGNYTVTLLKHLKGNKMFKNGMLI